MKRSRAALAVLLAAIVGCGQAVAGSPRLVVGETVAADFSALAETTFQDFVAAAPGVAACVGDVRLEAATALADAARYAPATNTITVRVPATAPSLRDSLVHELAHHIEATCESQREVRPAFLEAQGHGADARWFDGASWERTPSEQFAEAVVMAVLGQRRRNVTAVGLTAEAQAVVTDWLAGS